MTKICIVSSHSAERGLLQPLINRLEDHPGFAPTLLSLDTEADFDVNYRHATNQFKTTGVSIVLIPCDRAEALAATLAAFNLSIPIIHFHAGDVGTISKDEMYRHAISLMATVHLCNGPSAKKVVTNLLTAVGRPTALVYDVGSTAFDSDDDPQVSLCPDQPYDLVLYHPPTNDPDLINKELDVIEEILTTNIVYVDGHAEHMLHGHVCWIYPNGDPGSTIITERIDKVCHSHPERLYAYTNLPRTQFLGLVKNCRYFIGNSSSMVCEAPMWLTPDQILHIGNRNCDRSFDNINPGATDRIISILEVISCGPL